jgi:hypothetical protein
MTAPHLETVSSTTPSATALRSTRTTSMRTWASVAHPLGTGTGTAQLESGVVLDVNPGEPLQAARCGGTLTVLTDTNDWARLYFFGLDNADGARLVSPEIIDCDNPAPMP